MASSIKFHLQSRIIMIPMMLGEKGGIFTLTLESTMGGFFVIPCAFYASTEQEARSAGNLLKGDTPLLPFFMISEQSHIELRIKPLDKWVRLELKFQPHEQSPLEGFLNIRYEQILAASFISFADNRKIFL